MIIYKKLTKDEPVNNQIARLTGLADRWMARIICYKNRVLAGENLQRHIDFASSKLATVQNEITLLRRYAE